MDWFKIAVWPIKTMRRAVVTLLVFWTSVLVFWAYFFGGE